MKIYQTSTFRTLFAAAAVLSTLAVFSEAAVAQGTLEKVKAQGSVRIGFANETPFAYASPEGELTGLDVEILRHIFGKIGVKDFDGGLTNFGGLIPGLKAKRFDLVTSAIYIKPDRCQQVAFAEPLYVLGDGIAVKKGNPKKIHSYQDVAKDPSIKLAYTTGATGVTDNAKAMGVKESQLVAVPDDPSGYAAVRAGRVDGYATTGIILETQLRALKADDIEHALPWTHPVENGKPRFAFASFAVRLEDKDLLAELNKHLAEFRASPEYVKLMEKYGLTKDDMVKPEMTTAKVCGG